MPDPVPVSDVIVSCAVGLEAAVGGGGNHRHRGFFWSSGTSGSRIAVLKRPFLSNLDTRHNALWINEAVVVGWVQLSS